VRLYQQALQDGLPNKPQAGTLQQSVTKVSTLADAELTGPQTDTAQLCVGEKLMSLRQLIKYPADFISSINKVSASSDAAGGAGPFYYQPHMFGSTVAAGTSSTNFRDFLDKLGPYFRFNRGGMRVRMAITNLGGFAAGVGSAWVYPAVNNGVFGTDARPAPFGSNFEIPAGPNSAVGQFAKFTLPAWQTVPMVPNNYLLSTQAPPGGLYPSQSSLIVQFTGLGPSNTNYKVRFIRQPADDYELLFFIGPPLLRTMVSQPSPALMLHSGSVRRPVPPYGNDFYTSPSQGDQ